MHNDIPEDVMQSANTVVAEMLKEPMLAMAPFIARALKAERVRCEAALSAAEPVSSIVPDHCSGTALVFQGGCLHVRKDGSGYIVVDEDDFKLEDDRCEGEHGPEGSVHWIARFPAGEMTALRNFLNGQDLPAPPAPSSARPQCCMCGKKGLSTVEGDGGTECELSDGRWVCSSECYDRAVEPAPSVAVRALEATKYASELRRISLFVGNPDGDLVKTITSVADYLSALSAQVQDVAEWQDISTAPRDGTTVLLYAPGWDSPKTGWTYGTDDWQDCPYSRSGDERYQPTHWMPVPTKQGNRILHKHTNIRSGE